MHVARGRLPNLTPEEQQAEHAILHMAWSLTFTFLEATPPRGCEELAWPPGACSTLMKEPYDAQTAAEAVAAVAYYGHILAETHVLSRSMKVGVTAMPLMHALFYARCSCPTALPSGATPLLGNA